MMHMDCLTGSGSINGVFDCGGEIRFIIFFLEEVDQGQIFLDKLIIFKTLAAIRNILLLLHDKYNYRTSKKIDLHAYPYRSNIIT